MIVKDESRIIERCLASVKGLIDYWVIVDTGSSDGTREIIKNYLRDIPGELYERPWKNFAHNRNEALALAKTKADYILVIDADEVLAFRETPKLPLLDRDFYHVLSQNMGVRYYRVQLVRSALPWQWVGILHEGLFCAEATNPGVWEEAVTLVSWEGNRSKDPKKYEKDVVVLEEALRQEPGNIRTLFYLAQSYRDAGNLRKALELYEQRAAMGGWEEEVFWSLSESAKLKDQLQMPLEAVRDAYLRAYHFRPSRAEPLYYLARKYRIEENYFLGYALSKFALTIPLPNELLFVQNSIYDYELLLEFSACAYYLQKFDEAYEACLKLLSLPSLPSDLRESVKNNALLLQQLLSQR